MNRLEEWLEEVKKYETYDELREKCGVYNDFFYYMKTNQNQKETLINLMNNYSQIDENWVKLNEPEYNQPKKLRDLYGYLSKKNQFLFKFNHQGRKFESSFLDLTLNEREVEFNTDMQLYLFGDILPARDGLIYIAEEFILKEKIPTLVLGPNCKNPKFVKNHSALFSVYIN